MNKLIKNINDEEKDLKMIKYDPNIAMENRLNHYEYKNYVTNAYTQSIIQWIMKNGSHTFPVKKKRWIKAIESTKPLKKTNKLLNPVRTLSLFYNNEQIPYYFGDIRKCIHRKLKKKEEPFNRKKLFGFINDLKHVFKLYFNEDPQTILQFCIDGHILVPNKSGSKLFINEKLIDHMNIQSKKEGSKRNYSGSLNHKQLMEMLNDDMKKMKI